MNDLREAATDLMTTVQFAIKSGDWKVDGACDPTLDIERLRQALNVDAVNMSQDRVDETAKGKQEPVAWLFQHEETGLTDCVDSQQVEWGFEKNNPRWQKICPLYTAPPKKEWVGLTDDEVIECFDSVAFGQVEDDLIINKHVNIFRAIHGIEAKLKEKNNG